MKSAAEAMSVRKSLMSAGEASALIQSGQRLLLAGDEKLLSQLPRGEWIGGTIPYFMSEEGGLKTQEKVQVAVLPESVTRVRVKFYEAAQMSRIPAEYPTNGFTYIVLPAFSEVHQTFAKDCSTWPGIFNRPLVGWVSGVSVQDIAEVAPKVFNGATGESSISHAAVMHVDLPPQWYAQANIVNIFQQGSGATITFPKAGFEVTDCFVNGAKRLFSEYIATEKINLQLPLVANYMGAMVNACFQKLEPTTGTVALYAPVFPDVEYKFANPVGDYEAAFCQELERHNVKPVFTCNCILNYLYGNLEGKKTGSIVGPVTFGEIAYMLLNQTLVYLTLEKK